MELSSEKAEMDLSEDRQGVNVQFRGGPADRAQAALPGVLQTLASVAGQAVDIQLKILQALLSILTHNKDIHDDILGNVS